MVCAQTETGDHSNERPITSNRQQGCPHDRRHNGPIELLKGTDGSQLADPGSLFTETLAERQAETDRLGGQGSGTTYQQPSSGDASGTETMPHVPGERLDEGE